MTPRKTFKKSKYPPDLECCTERGLAADSLSTTRDRGPTKSKKIKNNL